MYFQSFFLFFFCMLQKKIHNYIIFPNKILKKHVFVKVNFVSVTTLYFDFISTLISKSRFWKSSHFPAFSTSTVIYSKYLHLEKEEFSDLCLRNHVSSLGTIEHSTKIWSRISLTLGISNSTMMKFFARKVFKHRYKFFEILQIPWSADSRIL